MKLIYIEWEDACANSSWRSIKDAKEWGKRQSGLVKECGWIVDENKEFLIMASRLGPEPAEGEIMDSEVGLLQKIPKTWIRKRKVIKL